MAKRRSTSRNNRVVSPNTSSADFKFESVFKRPLAYSKPRPNYLREFEDRRAWHPQGVTAPARSFSSTRHRLVLSNPLPLFVPRPIKTATRWTKIAFQGPKKVLVCVRRSIRKEVLHALHFTGRGSGGGKKRWSEYSSIHC